MEDIDWSKVEEKVLTAVDSLQCLGKFLLIEVVFIFVVTLNCEWLYGTKYEKQNAANKFHNLLAFQPILLFNNTKNNHN